jgi:hypothetical protein
VVGTFGAVETARHFRISLNSAYLLSRVDCTLLLSSSELMETLSLGWLKDTGTRYGPPSDDYPYDPLVRLVMALCIIITGACALESGKE